MRFSTNNKGEIFFFIGDHIHFFNEKHMTSFKFFCLKLFIEISETCPFETNKIRPNVFFSLEAGKLLDVSILHFYNEYAHIFFHDYKKSN